MEDISPRQIDILKAIIQEYSETGEAVGSEILERKYKLGVSPATIRNDMVVLVRKGYLKKAHFSSGREPSAKGFRFYITHLMKKKQLATTDEVAFKNSIWDERKMSHRLLAQATKVLAERTNLLSIVATNTGEIYYSGVANLLDKPEFFNLTVSRGVFELLDEVNYWIRILDRCYRLQEEIVYLLDEEDFRSPCFESYASIFGEFHGKNIKGIIGVVGPKRMYYDIITPQIRYFSSLIGEIISKEGY